MPRRDEEIRLFGTAMALTYRPFVLTSDKNIA